MHVLFLGFAAAALLVTTVEVALRWGRNLDHKQRIVDQRLLSLKTAQNGLTRRLAALERLLIGRADIEVALEGWEGWGRSFMKGLTEGACLDCGKTTHDPECGLRMDHEALPESHTDILARRASDD